LGGGAAPPHFLNDLRGPSAAPHFFLSCHWLLQIQFLSENKLTWHDQISNYTARNWRFPGLSTISANTIETNKSLNESDRFRTPHSTHVEGVVGRSAAAFCGAHSVNQGTAAAFPRHWLPQPREVVSVRARGGGRGTLEAGRWDKFVGLSEGAVGRGPIGAPRRDCVAATGASRRPCPRSTSPSTTPSSSHNGRSTRRVCGCDGGGPRRRRSCQRGGGPHAGAVALSSSHPPVAAWPAAVHWVGAWPPADQAP